MMTIDEAIKHAQEVAGESCTDCAKEHGQLARWLMELKQRRKRDEEEHAVWVDIGENVGVDRKKFICSSCESSISAPDYMTVEDISERDKFCYNCGKSMN